MKKIFLGIFCLTASVFAVPASGEPMAGSTDVATEAYQQGAFYVRLKSINAPKLKSGERKVPVNRLSSLTPLRETYRIHETMQSMRVFDNNELARTFLVEFDDVEKTDELLAKLAAMPEVEMVERVPAYFITGGMTASLSAETSTVVETEEPASPAPKDATMNDPFYGTQNGTNFSWHLDLIKAEEAWAQQQGTPNIVVAVVDNAVWGEHPDLQIPSSRQYNVLTGTAGNSAPLASVSQSTQCPGTSVTSGNCNVYNWSHGTHCAGAIGAINNNGVGIASIGSGVSVMGVSCPSTAELGLAVQNGFTGITYAAEHGARVISLSWGGYSISNTERAIVQACIDKGIVVVAATGNNGYKDSPFYPANLPGVISVSSVNSDRTISSFANYGSWVMVAGPGGYLSNNGNESNICIFSTTYCQSQRYRVNGVKGVEGEYYDGMFGTSMATPVVSGLCGLLLSADSTLSPYLLREILMAGAQPIEGNKNIQAGSGVIDAVASLNLVKDRKPMPRNLRFAREEGSRVAKLTWQAPEEGMVKAYRIYLNGVMKEEVNDTAWSEEILSEGLYHYGVTAVFEDGGESLKTCMDAYVPELCEVAITLRPEGCGNVLPESGFYERKDTLHLVAVPVKGCSFVRWMEDGKRIGQETTLDYVVSYDNTTIEAVFSGTPDVSVDDFAPAGSLKVRPNPAHETLFVESTDEIYRVEVYTLGGIRLLERDFPASATGVMQAELNVSRFAEGMYMLKVFGRKGVSVGKFLVK